MPTTRTNAPILVTGGSGHLGANLVRRLLADGHAVRVLIQRSANNAALDGLDVERVEGDLRNPTSLVAATKGCEQVFHTAAKVATANASKYEEREIYEINVIGTRNLLHAAKDSGVHKVVATGSFSAVGFDPDDPSRASDETRPFYPFAQHLPYARSKVLMEHECLKAVADGVPVVIATSCAIVGPNDFIPSRMGKTICDFVSGNVRAYIPGGFEFVASRDIVEGHVLAMKAGRAGQKYIFSTEFMTLEQMLHVLREVTGMRRMPMRLPVPMMAAIASLATPFYKRLFPNVHQKLTPGAIRILRMHRHADTTKAKTELGFRPTSMRRAFEDAHEFFLSRKMIRVRTSVVVPHRRVDREPPQQTPPAAE